MPLLTDLFDLWWTIYKYFAPTVLENFRTTFSGQTTLPGAALNS